MTEAPLDSVHCRTRAEWRGWLEQNHGRDDGVWMISFKKATGRARVEYEEAVEEALSFGWIDSKPRRLDAERSMLWFSPRKPGTGWSRHNKERVEKLLREGRMAPAGMAKVEAAKKDGSWHSLDGVEDLVVPADLAQALAVSPEAATYFEGFPRSIKRGILEWIGSAKRPETRAARIERTVSMAAENRRVNQWRG
jgi:uncharacterized protein YdeI (YjbR/CyaY-like superfamily)